MADTDTEAVLSKREIFGFLGQWYAQCYPRSPHQTSFLRLLIQKIHERQIITSSTQANNQFMKDPSLHQVYVFNSQYIMCTSLSQVSTHTVTGYVLDWFVTPTMLEKLGCDLLSLFDDYKQRTAWKKQIVKYLLPTRQHPSRWCDFCVPEDEKIRIKKSVQVNPKQCL